MHFFLQNLLDFCILKNLWLYIRMMQKLVNIFLAYQNNVFELKAITCVTTGNITRIFCHNLHCLPPPLKKKWITASFSHVHCSSWKRFLTWFFFSGYRFKIQIIKKLLNLKKKHFIFIWFIKIHSLNVLYM